MPVTFESVREFARTHGNVTVTAFRSVEIKILKSGEVDIIQLVEQATEFFFDGKRYTRQEFESLLSP